MTHEQLPVGLETMSPGMTVARNFYGWIHELIAPDLGRRILDVGAGAGTILHFLRNSEAIYALDVSVECIARIQAEFQGQANFHYLVGDICNPAIQADLCAAGIDTIICLTVLEHIERDDLALKAMCRILELTRGRLILIVPAHQILYGTMDRAAGHFRRYSRGRLRQLLRASGFRPVRLFYMNRLSPLLWFVNGRILRVKNLERPSLNYQIGLWDRYGVPVMRTVERWLPLPFGQSLVAIADVGDRSEDGVQGGYVSD